MPFLTFSSGEYKAAKASLSQESLDALLSSPYKTPSGLCFGLCGEAETLGGLSSGDRHAPSPPGLMGAVGPVWEGTIGRHLIRPCRPLSVSPQ